MTHIATKSIPTVLKVLLSIASFSLVPTPSVAESITGSLYPVGRAYAPAKEPMPPITFASNVDFTSAFIASTKSLPA